MAMFKNMMVYLGLGPDEEYDDRYLGDDDYLDTDDRRGSDDVDLGEPAMAGSGAHGVGRRPGTGVAEAAVAAGGAVGPVARAQSATGQPSAVGAVRPLRSVPTNGDEDVVVRRLDQSDDVGSASGTVRPVPVQRTKPKALSPQSFGDAKILADDFKRAVPVIMNLQGLDRDLARRLIDFASGVCYSLGGSMEKMAPQVFLLTPRSVEVSDEDRRRIEERGFDR